MAHYNMRSLINARNKGIPMGEPVEDETINLVGSTLIHGVNRYRLVDKTGKPLKRRKLRVLKKCDLCGKKNGKSLCKECRSSAEYTLRPYTMRIL
jgi:hypothetical protein